jgi:hypothetical protein
MEEFQSNTAENSASKTDAGRKANPDLRPVSPYLSLVSSTALLTGGD